MARAESRSTFATPGKRELVPKVMLPKASRETISPVFPRRAYCMRAPKTRTLDEAGDKNGTGPESFCREQHGCAPSWHHCVRNYGLVGRTRFELGIRGL